MGGKSSKNTNEAASELKLNSNLQYSDELRSYEAACRLDPVVKSFDITLQSRTNHVINTLADGLKIGAVSLDAFIEFIKYLHDMYEETAKILACEKDIWNNPELRELVDEYFQITLQTLKFCTTLENCVDRARRGKSILSSALQDFEKEDQKDEEGRNKYWRRLEELKAVGNPFSKEFFEAFQSLQKQHELMLKKLQVRKAKVDEKPKSKWRKVLSIIFATLLVSVLICKVLAVAMVAPPAVVALVAAAAVPLCSMVGSMGKWVDSLWKDTEDALKGQQRVINSMHKGTYIAIQNLDNIGFLVDNLKKKIESLLWKPDFALKDEEAVKNEIEDIRKKVDDFMKQIEELANHKDRCSRDILSARNDLLDIIKNQNN